LLQFRQEAKAELMNLTLAYPGDPESAKVINAATGEVVRNVKRFELRSLEPLGADELTITVIIPRKSPKDSLNSSLKEPVELPGKLSQLSE
jgi:hypothetical protein